MSTQSYVYFIIRPHDIFQLNLEAKALIKYLLTERKLSIILQACFMCQ